MTRGEACELVEEIRKHIAAGAKSFCITEEQALIFALLLEKKVNIDKANIVAEKYLDKYGQYQD